MKLADPGLDTAAVLRFAPFELDRRRAELRRDGIVLAMRPKTFALLSYLADNPGRVVEKEELLAVIWPGVVVTDDSLSQCVNEVRTALGDGDHKLIRTVPRRGYVFEASVEAGLAVPEARAAVAGGGALRAPWTRGEGQGPRLRIGPARPALRRPGLWVAGVLVAAALGSTLWLAGRETRVPVDQAVALRRTVAVMPFVALDTEKRDYFAATVTEDIAATIARLPHTLVIAPQSAAAVGARETDVRRIGKELGARYVLSGTVRRDGAAVQIAAQFASADSGMVMWSERFQYASVPDWGWQRDVGMRIARTLDRNMTFPLKLADARRGPPDVVEAVMQGHYLLRRSTLPADIARARALFERAVAADPMSVSALCGLAIALMSEVRSGSSPNPLVLTEQAAQAASRALALAPDNALAHYAMGNVLYVRDDMEGAMREYQAALEINPSDSFAHMRLGLTKVQLGRFEEVPAHMATAQRLNPLEKTLVSTALLGLAINEFHLRRDDVAYEHLRRATSVNANLAAAWAWMSAIDTLHDRSGPAAENLARALKLRPAMTVGSLLFIQRKSVPERVQPGLARFREAMIRAGLPE